MDHLPNQIADEKAAEQQGEQEPEFDDSGGFHRFFAFLNFRARASSQKRASMRAVGELARTARAAR